MWLNSNHSLFSKGKHCEATCAPHLAHQGKFKVDDNPKKGGISVKYILSYLMKLHKIDLSLHLNKDT